MANKKFLNPINLVNLSSDPSTASEGDIYYNTTDDVVKVYSNSVWVAIGAGGGSEITVSTTAPSSPTTGDAWYKNDTGEFYIYDGSFWVEVNGVIEGTNTFNTISVSGQSDVVADSSTDTLTLVAGTNVSITTNATNDSITINSAGTYTSVDSITYPDYITFDTTPETEPSDTGSLWWNTDFETLNLQLDAGVSLQIGQEHLIRVKNNSGSVAIPKGTVVMFAGATGDTVTASPAVSTSSSEPELLIGVTAEVIPADGFGFVTQFGFINGTNTETPGWSLGDLLYVDPANPGVLTDVKPSAPNWTFPVAAVTRVHASTGRILVRAIPGKHLHDVVDVAIDSPADNEVLAYNSGSGVWINQTSVEAGLIDTSSTAQTKTGNLTLTGTNSIYDTREYLYAVNDEGETVSALSAVVFNGVSSGVPKFRRADTDQIGQSGVVGLTIASIASGATGTIITRGIINGLNTASYADGQILYISTGGLITGTRPTGTTSRIHKIAKVIIADELDGKIYVLGTIEEDLPNLQTSKIWLGDSNDSPSEVTLSTTVVPEGTALYFTDERAQDAIGNNVGTGLSYNDSTGAISNSGVLSIIGTTNEIDILGTNTEIQIGIPDSPVFVTPNIGVATATSVNGTTIPLSKTLVVTTDIGSTVQAYDADLGAIAALTGTSGLLTTNGSGTWSVDTNTYSTTAHNHSINSLSNVVITGTPTDGQALVWDTTTSKWVNETVVQDLSAYVTKTGFQQIEDKGILGDLGFLNENNIGTDGYATIEYNSSRKLVIQSNPAYIGSLPSGYIDILANRDIVLSSTNGGEYLGSVSSNNQIATLGDLSSYLPVTGGTLTGALTLPSDPTTAFQAATKQYVDEIAQGLNVKPSVHAATTENLSANYNNGIDGVGATLTSTTNGEWVGEDGVLTGWDVFNSILVKDQTNAEENGRYYISDYGSSTTPWVLTRCIYCDTSDEIPGSYIFVTDGDTYAGTGWVAVIDTPATFEIGTDDINYTQFSGTGTIIAGTNIEVDGNEISVVDAPTFTGTLSAATLNLTNALGYAYGGTGLSTLGTAGQVLKVNSAEDALEWGDSGGAGGLYVSDTAPPSPTEGIGWYNNETGKIFVFDGTYWVEATNNLTDEDIMDTVAQMVADGTHSNIDITYNDLSNSLSFNVLSEPITDFLTLNEEITGTPTGNAGIIVNRGDLTDVSIRFNETEDQWEYTNDGAEYQSIGSGGGAVSTNTALSNSFWLGA